jgi:hypothetical protein
MSIGISKLFEEAELLADQRRLLPAIQALEEARRLTKIPDRRAWASYNLGTIHWHLLGNGEAARREFLASISDFDTHGYGQHIQLRVVHANALENAMLCALSFDEFENFAARLHVLTPGVPILTGLVPEIRDAHERGDPWSDRLFSLAGSYYNRNDPRRDVGRYGEAKSTYHLLLTHRRQLRVSREDWCMAVFEYCALSMRMASDCMKVRGGDGDPNSPEEFLPILTEAMPLADEYLTVNSGDDDLKKVRGDMDKMVTGFRERWASLNERTIAMPHKTDYQVCQNCGTVFARRDTDGPEFMTGMMDIYDHPTMCPKCGGQVVWQASPNVGPKLERGCLPVLLLLIVAAMLGVLVAVNNFWK